MYAVAAKNSQFKTADQKQPIHSQSGKIHVDKNSVPRMAKKEKSKKVNMANFDRWPTDLLHQNKIGKKS